MNRFSEQDVARKLASFEAPPPPADLLDRLVRDIPQTLPPIEEPVFAEPDPTPGGAPAENPAEAPEAPTRWWSPRWLAAAAVLVMMIGGGFLALRLEERMAPAELGVERPAPDLDRSGQLGASTTAAAGAEAAATQGAKGELLAGASGRRPEAVQPPPREEPAPSDELAQDAAEALRSETRKVAPPQLKIPDRTAPPALLREKAAGPPAPTVQEGHEDQRRPDADAEAEVLFYEPEPVVEASPAEPRQAPMIPKPPAARKQPRPEAQAAPRGGRVEDDLAASIPDRNLEVGDATASHHLRDRSTVAEIDRALSEAPPRTAPQSAAPPSTGGTAEPNGQAYGDVFFDAVGTNPFIDTEDDALSTFGLDVDTASYTVVRRYLRDGHLPPPAAVRVEEMVNYFSYGDPPPRRGDFALHAEGGPAVFAHGPRYRLLRFHLRARDLAPEDRRAAVLMLVVDVSGSMDREDRLGTVRRSLAMLLDRLEPEDRVGLVTFGSTARLLVEPTGDRVRLRRAIESLLPEGSTNAEAGLVLAYETLARYRRPGVNRRVILCSDGVANVGATAAGEILERVHREAEGGIELTTLGFGMGNYNDVLMERLADQGDGRYAYVDDLEEARRVLVEELTGTLETVASDARVQVEFDPEVVERYRLLGYENRDLADHRFRDDTADAGEIGAGHGVTALYEVKLAPGVEDPDAALLATLRLRYRSATTGRFEETAQGLRLRDLSPSWQASSRTLRLASVVAEFAEILRGSYWAKDGDLHEVFRRAQQVSAEFPGDTKVAELAALIGRAAELEKLREGEDR